MKKRIRLILTVVLLLLLFPCLFFAKKAADGTLAWNNRFGRIQAGGVFRSTLLSPERTPVKNSTDAPLSTLQHGLDRELRHLPGQWDVWVESLASSDALHIRRNIGDEDVLVSASLIKLFIMGAVYDQIERGILSEDEVCDQLCAMITVSDNDAANELTLLLGGGDSAAGMNIVNDWAASVGCRGVQHNRLMLAGNGLENYVTAEACAELLSQIYRGECVSSHASGQMLSLLLNQQVNDRIPADLPEGTAVAHKTGDLIGLCTADVGIIFSPGGDYILCVICNRPPQGSHPAAEIARLSKLVYTVFNA